jgi:hypothetical protein
MPGRNAGRSRALQRGLISATLPIKARTRQRAGSAIE